MSQQPSVASYFGKRKKVINDDIYRSKILKTDDNSSSSTISSGNEFGDSKPRAAFAVCKNENKTPSVDAVKKCKTSGSIASQAKGKPKGQLDIRESMKQCEKLPSPNITSPVKFQLLGSLSPAKRSNRKAVLNNETDNSLLGTGNEGSSEDKVSEPVAKKPSVRVLNFEDPKIPHSSTDDIIISAKKLASKIKETQKKLLKTPQKKELSLKEIKDKLKRSSKLNELKKSINKINEHAEELIQLEKRKLSGTQPKLSKFKTIKLEVPVSPKKNVLYSPVKVSSPSKPAYERFASLTKAPTLPLPFGYQKLYEFFQAVDLVCSIVLNRGEIVKFSKLKPAVEEMTRKNFTARHLGQMATVLPEAFKFYQQKIRNYGSTSKADRYELIISPKISNNQINPDKTPVKEDDVFWRADRSVMTPKIMKARKESFYESLLERTKDYHEEFLKTLDPPISINRNDLKRWHPNFMVDLVPDVNPQELPQPPTTEKAATAREILERAKDVLSSNARLQKALEAAAGSSADPPDSDASKVPLDIKRKVDARLDDPLKGISKSLLEKVRARQTAKALDAMRTTREQEKESLMYERLPEIARIVRTIFVNEQKAVLLLLVVLEKVQFSYSRNLNLGEVEAHVRLLCQKLPEWLSIVNIRYANYLKINRSVDVTSVMTKLKEMVEGRKQETKSL